MEDEPTSVERSEEEERPTTEKQTLEKAELRFHIPTSPPWDDLRPPGAPAVAPRSSYSPPDVSAASRAGKRSDIWTRYSSHMEKRHGEEVDVSENIRTRHMDYYIL